MLKLESLDFLDGCRLLITGGTGSLGKQLTRTLLEQSNIDAIIIYSRDEFKQFEMQNMFPGEDDRARLRFFLGDVRDEQRLTMAMERVDYVIHAAALKQVPAAEFNPFEFVKTNILGAGNVINAALHNNVKNVIALSTDKASNPINLYGATKLCSDKLFIAGNHYSGLKQTSFSVVRYGNVVGSRGSVIPFFLEKRKEGVLPITDPRMTRFWITLEEAVAFVLNALREMRGGEMWVPKIHSMKITDLADVISPECEKPVIGIRPGEKLHEIMITPDESIQTFAFDTHYIVTPSHRFTSTIPAPEYFLEQGGEPCDDRFYYSSDNNHLWLSRDEIASMICALDLPAAREWAAELRN